MPSPQLTLHDVSHSYDSGRALFDPISDRLTAGKTYAIVGRSGSGKSSLLQVLAGWLTPAAGFIRRSDVERVQWVSQNPFGVGSRRVLDLVSFPLMQQGLSRGAAEVESLVLLDQMNLAHVAGRPYRELSGGEGQRYMFARAVASAPDLLLVDEPTAQLDADNRRLVNEAIARMARSSCIVVVATHDDETRASCSRALVLDKVNASN